MVAPRILIVEEHHVFSEALELVLGQRLLREHDGRPEFRRAATATGGLGLLRKDGPFDVAVVDPTLPDAAEVFGELRASHPRTRVAALGSVRDLSGVPGAWVAETIGKERPLAEMISRLSRLAGGGDRSASSGPRGPRKPPRGSRTWNVRSRST